MDKNADMKQVEKTLKNTGTDSGSDISESLSELLDNMSDEDMNILFSELTEDEINHLTVLATVENNDEVTKRFINQYRNNKVSKRRKGRKELVSIADSFSGVFESQEQGKLERLKGLVR